MQALNDINPDNLSPKEALDVLYRLKTLVPGSHQAQIGPINAMLTPIPLPRAPEAAASLLSDALAGIAEESGRFPRGCGRRFPTPSGSYPVLCAACFRT